MTTLSCLKDRQKGWHCLYFPFSKLLDHRALVSDIAGMPDKISVIEARRDSFLSDFEKAAGSFNPEGHIYAFTDLDVLALLRIGNVDEKEKINGLYEKIKSSLPEGYSDMRLLEGFYQNYMKFSDRKILGRKKHEAYQTMLNRQKVEDIGTKRKYRMKPLVMIVEDDQFTAYYASSILETQHDLISVGTGEDAIKAYIENAPDAVFIDIHLPGLTGHEVHEAIRAADPDAYVIMLSADAVMDNISRATQSGASKFLKKPFSRERLIGMVRNSPHVKIRRSGNPV